MDDLNDTTLRENLYAFLEVPVNATFEQIRTAFRKKILKYHPDKKNGDAELAKKLIKANRILTDALLRRKYDARRSENNTNDDDGQQEATGDKPELPSGQNKSNIYRQLIKEWIKEYEDVELEDNYFEIMTQILQETIQQIPTLSPNVPEATYRCFLCRKSFTNEAHHDSEIYSTYIHTFLDDAEIDVFEKLKNVLETDDENFALGTNLLPQADLGKFWGSSEWTKIKPIPMSKLSELKELEILPTDLNLVAAFLCGSTPPMNFVTFTIEKLLIGKFPNSTFLSQFSKILGAHGSHVKQQDDGERSMEFVHIAEEAGYLLTWKDLRENALSQRKFERAVLYTKLESISNSDSHDDHWFSLGVELHAQGEHELAQLCFLMGSCDVQEVAEYFRKQEDHKLALAYYEKGRRSFDKIWSVGRDLCQNSQSDDNNRSGWKIYACWLLLKIQNDKMDSCTTFDKVVKFVIEILADHVDESTSQSILVSAGYSFPEQLGEAVSIPLHKFMKNYFSSRSIILALGAYHYELDLRKIPEHVDIMNQFHLNMHSSLEHNYRKSVRLGEEDFELLCGILVYMRRDSEYLESLENLFRQSTGGFDIQEFPPSLKAMHLIIRGTIHRMRSQTSDALRDYHQSFVTLPSENVSSCLAALLQDSEFHIAVIKLVYEDVEKLARKYSNRISIRSNDLLEQIHDQQMFLGTSIEPIKEHMLRNVFKFSPDQNYLYPILRNEMAIDARLSENHLEAAFAYINVSDVASDPGGLIGSLMMACVSLVRAMTNPVCTPASLYAYRNCIFLLLTNAFLFSRRRSTPLFEAYICKSIFNISICANELIRNSILRNGSRPSSSNRQIVCKKRKEELIEPNDIAMFKEVLDTFINLAHVSPLIGFPTQSVLDTIFTDVKGLKFLTNFYKYKLERTFHPTTLPLSLYAYHQFEGFWRGWLDERDTGLQFSTVKLTTMRHFLKEKAWNMFQVQELLERSNLPRTQDGWRIPNLPYTFSGSDSFTGIYGVEINLETGVVKFFLSQEKNQHRLITYADIHEIFHGDISFTEFTLDQPVDKFNSHPFQEAKYCPKEVGKTRLYDTLADADYLLKELATGVEVNSNPPFNVRQSTVGLIPEELKEILRPVHERPNHFYSELTEQAHRFWIEMEEIIIDQGFNDNNNTKRFMVGEVKASIRKHRLRRDHRGQYVDDDEDEDTEKSSAEAHFAKELSQNYDRIGKSFPELLRLKELTKIMMIYRFVKSTLKSIEESIEDTEKQSFLSDASLILTSIRREVTYPLNTEAHLQQEWNKFSNDFYARYGRNSNYYIDYSVTSSQIRSQLAKADESCVNQLAAILGKLADTSLNLSHIHSWLVGNQSYLQNAMAVAMKCKRLKMLRNLFSNIMKSLGISKLEKDENEVLEMGSQGECVWYPAAFANQNGISNLKIYGGIRINPLPVNGRVHRIFSARVLERMTADKGHGFGLKTNFVERLVFQHGDVQNSISKSGYPYRMYTHPGTLNNNVGTYEIGARVYTTKSGNQIEKIDHMVFKKSSKK